MARKLDGQVALVTGGGDGLGRAIALALGARGVRVVVTGGVERALGETVGELAHAGAKARHVAGDVRDPSHLERVVDRAIEVFGGLDIVVADGSDPLAVACTLEAAAPRMAARGRLLVVGRRIEERDIAALSSRGIRCEAIVGGENSEEEIAALVVSRLD